jgi:hypothetical protein
LARPQLLTVPSMPSYPAPFSDTDYFSAVKMEAADTSETLVNFDHTTRGRSSIILSRLTHFHTFLRDGLDRTITAGTRNEMLTSSACQLSYTNSGWILMTRFF